MRLTIGVLLRLSLEHVILPYPRFWPHPKVLMPFARTLFFDRRGAILTMCLNEHRGFVELVEKSVFAAGVLLNWTPKDFLLFVLNVLPSTM